MEDAVISRRWETSTRYYLAVLQRDLLGDWVLTVAHGGRNNRLGAIAHRAVGSRASGIALLDAIAKTRKKHGYLAYQGAGDVGP